MKHAQQTNEAHRERKIKNKNRYDASHKESPIIKNKRQAIRLPKLDPHKVQAFRMGQKFRLHKRKKRELIGLGISLALGFFLLALFLLWLK